MVKRDGKGGSVSVLAEVGGGGGGLQQDNRKKE
jgi:hypothetical protein